MTNIGSIGNEINQLKDLIRSLATKLNDTNQYTHLIHQELKSSSSEATTNTARPQMSSETPINDDHQELSTTVHNEDVHSITSNIAIYSPKCSKSVQTEKSTALEKELKQYIQMLQVELEKRSKEAVVSATLGWGNLSYSYQKHASQSQQNHRQ